MNRPLSAKIAPIEAGIEHAKRMIDPTSVTLHTSGGENHDHSETASAGDRAYRLGTANKIRQENKCN